MAVFSWLDRSGIDEICAQWREGSLIGDASLLYPETYPDAWSAERLVELNGLFWGNLLEGEEAGGTFASKWERQLQGADIEVRLLAAEVLLIYYLPTEAVGRGRKVEMINMTIGPDHPELHIVSGSTVDQALRSGIANPGLFYNSGQPLLVGYLMDLALRIKQRSPGGTGRAVARQPVGFRPVRRGRRSAVRRDAQHGLPPPVPRLLRADRVQAAQGTGAEGVRRAR
ncbi:hypothetical protein MUG78_03880 [Gordonia alkaliphila]|uniref:hypothetical protein n=1 Tax=Gordonia alkaliphila TaxID=1053547 RepID=UPI001FF217B6|nr:hypothetical protein [Gordonia alkaliphila]MCK0438627.1 hypothetical protein [Gordonia alkaliphila]